MHHRHIEVRARAGRALPRAVSLIHLASYLNIRMLQQLRVRSHALEIALLRLYNHRCLHILVHADPCTLLRNLMAPIKRMQPASIRCAIMLLIPETNWLLVDFRVV